MARFETTVEQELRDHGLDQVLGLGRGVLKVDGLSDVLNEESRAGENRVLEFISDTYRGGTNGWELAEAIASDKPRGQEILTALEQCSVHSALNAVLDTGSARQKEYLVGALKRYAELVNDGTIVKGYDDKGNWGTHHKPANPDDIKTGLWRDIITASMIGTPEMGALSLARRWTETDAQKEGSRRSVGNLPATRGYHSYIFPPKEEELWEYRDGERVQLPPEHKNGTVGYAFPELAKTYEQVRARIGRKHPEAPDETIEHESVLELARIVAKSTEYNSPYRGEGSPYRSGFAEQMAWAQLGDQVQRQFRGMRQKIMGVDMHNIGRFIGKSGDNPYEKDWRKIEEFAGAVSPDNVGPAKEYLFTRAHAQIRRQHRLRGNDEAGAIIMEGASNITEVNSLTDDEVLARFHEIRDSLEARRNGHMSLAQKALYLHFQDAPQGGGRAL